MPHIERLKSSTIEAADQTDEADKTAEKADPADGTQGIIVVREPLKSSNYGCFPGKSQLLEGAPGLVDPPHF